MGSKLTNAFSKKWDNLKAALAAFRTLKVTPAMESGIADHVWSMQELLEVAP